MMIYLICVLIIVLNYLIIPVMFDSLEFIGGIIVATSVNLIVCTVISFLYRILEALKDTNYILNHKHQEIKETRD